MSSGRQFSNTSDEFRQAGFSRALPDGAVFRHRALLKGRHPTRLPFLVRFWSLEKANVTIRGMAGETMQAGKPMRRDDDAEPRTRAETALKLKDFLPYRLAVLADQVSRTL